MASPPRPSYRALVAEGRGFPVAAENRLRTVADLVIANLDRPALLDQLADVDVVWVRLRHRIDDEVLAHAPRLRLIATPTTGLTHVDQEATSRRGVEVVCLRGDAFLSDVWATAEYTLALLLALVRQLPEATVHVRAGGWDRYRFVGAELHGKTAGVIGYGRLGRMVGQCLRALGMRVLASDPAVDASTVEPGVTIVSLTELLEEADVVTIHANYEQGSPPVVTRDDIESMKPGTWLVNTSRGEVLDEGALLDALRAGHLAGAAVDVLTGEGADGMGWHPLVAYAREHANLLVTPHLGGCTVESMEKAESHLAEKVALIVEGWR